MINYAIILAEFYSNKFWGISNFDYEGIEWKDSSPQPSKAELDALWIPAQEQIAKRNCKKQASELLYETDWTTISDVADPANSPYLKNQSEFIAWRSQVRALAVNPVVDPVFPPKPTEIWG